MTAGGADRTGGTCDSGAVLVLVVLLLEEVLVMLRLVLVELVDQLMLLVLCLRRN